MNSLRTSLCRDLNKTLSIQATLLYSLLLGTALSMISCSEEAKPKTAPVVLTGEISGISANGALVSGQVVSDGGSAVTERGVVLGSSADPTTADTKVTSGSGVGTYSASLTGLLPGTVYHVRAYAVNARGTSYGLDKTFSTSATLATVTTVEGSAVALTSATTGGTIASDGGAAVTARGVVYGTSPNPTLADNKTTDGAGTGTFVSALTGLKPSTTYFVRAYATTSVGTAYGSQVTINTVAGLVDVEGNAYASVVIGTQTWMKENLKVSKYRNGDPIPNITTGSIWGSLVTGAFAFYGNDITNDLVYGKLYNWYAAVDPRGVCPTGWHVPTNDEWIVFSDYLGGEPTAGGKMKSTGAGVWSQPNIGATNQSGFTALPGGFRSTNGDYIFERIGSAGIFWSTTAVSGATGWHRYLLSESEALLRDGGSFKVNGFSIRCLKD